MPNGQRPAPPGAALLERTSRHGAMGGRFVLAVTDGDFKVVAASPQVGRLARQVARRPGPGGQPLFMFGERAGVMDVSIDGQDWYAAVDITDSRTGAAAALIAAGRRVR